MGERADNLIIKCAMRYGNPGIPQVLEEMRQANLKYLYVLPLYPHYSAATTGSIFDAISDSVRRWRYTPELHFLQSYHDNDAFIELCCKQIEAYWEKNGKPEKLFLSYHGLPLRCLHSGDPYHCQCHKTTRLIQEKLGVDDNIVQTVFQSRFGRETWLQPYLDSTLESSAKKGLKNVQVFCPGFSVDCLETLEEIAIQGKESFIESGGETFNYIPALNDNEDHATMLKGLMAPVIELWMKQLPDQRLLERQTKLATNQVENQL